MTIGFKSGKKTTVGVLRGGPSQEYDISLTTGKHILNLLKKEPLCEEYNAVDIFVDRDGVWHISGAPVSPEEAVSRVDVLFNAMHGAYGGDGRLQSVLDSFAKPYTGTKGLGSAMALNKALAKENFKNLGIKSPFYKEVNIKLDEDVEPVAHDLFKSFPMPVIIKPRSSGSSLGISIAHNFTELMKALEHTRGFSEEIVVEEYLTGKEIISGFIEDFRGQDLYNTVPVQVRHEKTSTSGVLNNDGELSNIGTGTGHFDWASKTSGIYNYEAPAMITEEEKGIIENAMRSVKESFNLRHYGTFDFLIHPKRGVYLLEVNTQPSLQEEATLFKSLGSVGVKAHEFLGHVLKLAMGKK
ncbi:MAG: ATP-grasp domain-containing protein [bacterium]